jgi:hypothetical protein
MRIDLTPTEEARLSAVAKQNGLAPEEFVKRLTLAHLPPVPATVEEAVDAKLRRWQEQDGKALLPDVSTQELFAKWAEEDAHMTLEEQAENDRIYAEIEQNGIPRVRI